MQTRRHSLIEAAANVAVGYSINFVANLTVLPLFGLAVSAGDAAGIGECGEDISAGDVWGEPGVGVEEKEWQQS